jgi:RNA polymerase-binding transcription factor DksA
MDDADRAQLQEEQHLAAALERAASLARSVLGHAPTSNRCEECGAEIEPQRLQHGFAVCYACAEWRERWAAKWSRR